MDLRALRYFVTVYETGSFSAASKRLYIAQPSISAAIKQLETSLSCTLFLRLARGVKPTDAGETLYPLAQQLLGQAAAIRQTFSASPAKLPFRLGLVKGLGVTRMSGLLKRFTAQVETLELTLVPAEEQCDARIISQDMCSSGEQFFPMWQERYMLALPHHHPLSLTDSLSVEALNGMAVVQRGPCEGWNQLQEQARQMGITLDIRARIQTVEYALGLVNAGLGLAFVPVSDELIQHADVSFKSLNELNLTRQIGLAYRQPSAVIEALKEIL